MAAQGDATTALANAATGIADAAAAQADATSALALANTSTRVIYAASGNPLSTMSATAMTTLVTVSLPAGTLTNGIVQVVVVGSILQNSGASQNIEASWRLNGVEMNRSSGSLNNDTDRQGFRVQLELVRRTASGQFTIQEGSTASPSPAAVGMGNWTSKFRDGLSWNQLVAQDETLDLDLEWRARLASSAVSSDITVYAAYATFIPFS